LPVYKDDSDVYLKILLNETSILRYGSAGRVNNVSLIFENLTRRINSEDINDVNVNALLQALSKNIDENDWNSTYNTAIKLRSILRPFDTQLFNELIRLVENADNKILEKDVLLSIGATGSGKSVTTHVLCGSTIKNMTSEDGAIYLGAGVVDEKCVNITIGP
jgi:hypothetical protein